MTDLYTALAIVLSISFATFALGLSLGRRLSPRTAGLVAVVTCAFVVVFALRWRDHLAITRVLPFSAVLIYGNVLPPAVALLAGLAWRLIPGSVPRKTLLVMPFTLLCLYQSYGFLLHTRPPLENR